MPLNVKSKNIIEKLNMLDETGDFKKYPMMMLRNTARVRVNPDDYLMKDDFMIVSPYFNLPREIYLYGKKGSSAVEDNIYFNYWMDVFVRTIEHGYINYDKFEKSNSKYEMTIGIPFEFRKSAYYNYWSRENVINFLSCLFDVRLEEVDYQQQDMLELMAA